jgi:hypothetical protein
MSVVLQVDSALEQEVRSRAVELVDVSGDIKALKVVVKEVSQRGKSLQSALQSLELEARNEVTAVQRLGARKGRLQAMQKVGKFAFEGYSLNNGISPTQHPLISCLAYVSTLTCPYVEIVLGIGEEETSFYLVHVLIGAESSVRYRQILLYFGRITIVNVPFSAICRLSWTQQRSAR